MTTDTVTGVLREIACHPGLPSCLKTDGGPAYIYAKLRTICNTFGICHTVISAYNHQSNGQAERGIQDINKIIHRNGSKKQLEELLLSLNSRDRLNGNGTPIKLLFKHNVWFPLPNSCSERVDLQENLSKSRQIQEILAKKRAGSIDIHSAMTTGCVSKTC